jgi:SsrA-binding protein
MSKVQLKNRSAYYDYAIEDKFIAGMVLSGTEIKSIRASRVSFNDAFCFFSSGELYVKSLHISAYTHGTFYNHDPLRERKLLLTKKELRKLDLKIREKGYSIIPLFIFISDNGYAKMEIGLGKGKKVHDKRDSIRERENDREMRRGYLK